MARNVKTPRWDRASVPRNIQRQSGRRIFPLSFQRNAFLCVIAVRAKTTLISASLWWLKIEGGIPWIATRGSGYPVSGAKHRQNDKDNVGLIKKSGKVKKNTLN